MSGAISPLSPHAALQPASDANKNAAKLRHAATEFESILVKQLLKAAKLGGGEGDKGNGYADMTVDALASAVERGGGLGLAHRIEQAIGHAAGPAQQTTAVGVEGASSAARNVHGTGSGDGG